MGAKNVKAEDFLHRLDEDEREPTPQEFAQQLRAVLGVKGGVARG